MPDFESVQKLALELKCPLCLRLFNRPTLLPCNHVFCKSCIPGYTADCPVCKARFVDRDLRHLPFMEKMLAIYKGSTDAERVSGQTPASTNIWFSDKMNEELPENAQVYNSRSGLSIDKVFGVDKNGKVENRESKRRDSRIEFSAAGNQNLSSPRFRMRGGGTDDFMTHDVAQSSPDSHSPPSFGEARCSDTDSYYRCSERSSANSFIKRPSGENNASRVGKLRNDGFGFRKDGNFREVKKQKQLNYGAFTTKSESKLQKQSQPDVQEPKILDGQRANETICAFCHASEISEDTGAMLHYSSGKLVEGDEATLPNVIHVHKVCFDWAPQVYYVDDRVQNLKEEVARGAKLKCYACGKKGAALGCYVKSCRRSYHVPCAMKVSRCRWAYEDYLMLCPAHYSVRFPNEKSKSSKIFSKDHDKPAIASCHLSNSVPSPDEEKKLCFCGSALSTEEMILLVKFGMMNGATVSKFWNPNVTHVIAATDDKGACTRTLKFLMAILTGRWVVKVDWIKACMEAKCNVNEEPYEVSLDNYGCRDGPKTGRLRASNNAPKLFSGLNFYFVGDFLESHKEDLHDLVIAAGGTVLKCREELVAQTSEEAAPTPRALVVYDVDRPEGCRLGAEGAILFQRLSEAEDIASQTGSEAIGQTWLLESIAGHKLQSVVS